jgi:putative endonuclease
MDSKITSKRLCPDTQNSPTARGNAAEDQALELMRQRGWHLLQRHYRSPGRGGGEIDFVMRDPQGVIVFVEVRQRTRADHGGALASVTRAKQRRIIWAARHFLHRWPGPLPYCRFDVLALGASGVQWIEGAFTL